MTEQSKVGLWSTADAYDRYMGRWSRLVAPLLINWLDPRAGARWADIGCGTGTLARVIRDRCAPVRLVGIDTSPAFLSEAAKRVEDIELSESSADKTGLPDDRFDYSVSGLVLNFVPDAQRMVREMRRITRPGGQVALYVWDYAGHMQIIRYFFDAARMVDPNSREVDEGVASPLCRPAPLRKLFLNTGFDQTEVTALDVATAFDDFNDYWEPFLGGVGPAPTYCASLDERTRNKIKEAVREKLPTGPDGEILLAARAWAIKGTVVK